MHGVGVPEHRPSVQPGADVQPDVCVEQASAVPVQTRRSISQVEPENPYGHSQWNDPTSFTHVPPFAQRFPLAHSSTSTAQFAPV